MNLSPQNNIYYSADFEICPELGQIKAGTETIRLGPVNMKVLIALLNNQGKVTSRTELFDEVWKNQVVSDDALTRCISDLRTQLGQHCSDKLIETIPKRGYRWIAKVIHNCSQKVEIEDTEIENSETEKPNTNSVNNISTMELAKSANSWHSIVYWATTGILSFLFLSTLLLWGVNQFVRTDVIRVALLPLQVEDKQYKDTASHFEDLLKAALLKTDNIRFLSSRTMNGNQQNLYPYLSREFAAQWIIESRLVYLDEKLRISINIVDAKTAIVTQSFYREVSPKETNLQDIVKLLLIEIEANID